MSEPTTTEEVPEKKKRRGGCLIPVGILGAALLGAGIYILARGESPSGAGRAGGILLVVFGTLVLIPPLLMLIVALALGIFMRKIAKGMEGFTKGMEGVNAGAAEIVERNKKVFGAAHEYRDVTGEDFATVDRAWYESTTTLLASHGFTLLGDTVNVTLEQTFGVSTPIRVLASSEGTTVVALYHVTGRLAEKTSPGSPVQTCEAQTELSDGTYLITANTRENDLMTPPPALLKDRLPRATAPLDVIAAHEARRRNHAVLYPDKVTTVVRTMEEAMELQKREHQAKVAFREGIGYTDPLEVKRVADANPNLDPGTGDVWANATDRARFACPKCGRDLRGTPGKCPECGDVSAGA